MATNTNSKSAPKSTAPAFDYASLKPVAAEVPAQNRDAKPNPFKDWLSESYAEWTEDNTKGGRKVTVPAANAGEVRNLIRRAADSLEIGSRVVMQDAKGKVLDQRQPLPKSGDITVLYCGRDRKARKSTEAATPAAS